MAKSVCTSSPVVEVERRTALRFETTFLVLLRSRLHGALTCIARNVSEGGLFVEAGELFPLGDEVEVCVLLEGFRPETIGMAVVQNHYSLAFDQSGRLRHLLGMGLRFLGPGDGILSGASRPKHVH